MPGPWPHGAPFEALARCGARLLLIGGNAMIAYGSQRLTQDCDCAVVVGDEHIVAEALRPLGYCFKSRTPNFARYTHIGARRPVIDVMLLDQATFDGLRTESRLVEVVEGVRLAAPKPMHLVALKLHALKQQPSRIGKDWEDIVFLLESRRSEWTPQELAALAEEYASEETATLLRNAGLL